MSGKLVGIGVGPGDPELLTVKGLRALREADEVFVPVGDTGEIGRAEAVVKEHLGEDAARVRRLLFALSNDAEDRARNWTNAAQEVAETMRRDANCAFATIGDPNLYSTFTYLARAVRGIVPEVEVSTVPGITAMQELASRSGTVLLVGDERLALLPFTAGKSELRSALNRFETVVCYKGGGRLNEVLEVARETGRSEDGIYGSWLGMNGGEIVRLPEMSGREGTDLSTGMVKRGGEGGRGV